MEYSRLDDANIITQKYMDSILFEERLTCYNNREHNGLEEYSMAAKQCNILNFCGISTGADIILDICAVQFFDKCILLFF